MKKYGLLISISLIIVFITGFLLGSSKSDYFFLVKNIVNFTNNDVIYALKMI